MEFAERDKCKTVLLRLSLAENLEKPLMSLSVPLWDRMVGACHACGYGLKNQLGASKVTVSVW
jgi:hypothetical protein